MTTDPLSLPDGAASRAATEVAAAYCSPALLNHCVRSYVWAAALATREHIAFDPELLHVAAMLHDIALVDVFDAHAVPFEEAGGHVAWVFGAGAGWPVARRVRVAEVIVRHMWDEVDVESDAEGYLLEVATGLDISGRGAERWPAGLRREVLARWPRLGLQKEFLACFQEQARRKPESAAGRLVATGIADRIAANVLDGTQTAPSEAGS
jgi:hypothetical protein